MKRKSYIVTFSILFLAGIISCGGGGKTTKSGSSGEKNRGQATGYAAIFDGDNALARDRARDDAQNKLVKKILGNTVSGQSLVEDFQLVSSIVETKSIGLVKDLKIIKVYI